MRPVAVLLVVVVLVVAGCAAPTAPASSEMATEADSAAGDRPAVDGTTQPTPTETTTAESTPTTPAAAVEVDGNLSVDATAAFRRTRALLDANDTEPPEVTVERSASESTLRIFNDSDRVTLRSTLGVEAADPANETDRITVGGATLTGLVDPIVYVQPGANSSAGDVERTLAHEFVHAIQFRRDVLSRLRDAAPDEYSETTDSRLARRSVIEGAAVYGSTAYTDRYLPEIDSEATILREIYPNTSAGTRLRWAPYRFGWAFLNRTYDSPADHWSVYDDPPPTTEGILHADADERRPLTVTVDSTDADWLPGQRDTKGELYLRAILAGELNATASAAAADGWGFDRSLRFTNESLSVGYVWVLRWDDPDEAAEFRRLFGTYLSNHADPVEEGAWDREDRRYRLLTVDETGVVLVVGPREFADRVTVEGPIDEVTVSVESTG